MPLPPQQEPEKKSKMSKLFGGRDKGDAGASSLPVPSIPPRRASMTREMEPEPEMQDQQAVEAEMLQLMNEYFYGMRIFPGQDPNLVYVGWVTTQYHIHSLDFTQDMVRNVTVQKLDGYGGVVER